MASEKKIEGTLYRFEPLVGWPAWDSLDLLIKIAGPVVPLIEAIVEENDQARTIAIARLAPDIMKNHDGASLRALIDMLFANCRADNMPVVVGVKPQGLPEMFALAAFCLEKQFGGFFGAGGLGALMKLLPQAPAKAA